MGLTVRDIAEHDPAPPLGQGTHWFHDAMLGLITRHLIDTEWYDTLTWPWRTVVGHLHHGDPEAKLTDRQLMVWNHFAPTWPHGEYDELAEVARSTVIFGS
jgi:hypothetical protein